MLSSLRSRFLFELNKPQTPEEQDQIRRAMLDCVEPGLGYSVLFLIGCVALYGHVPTVYLVVAGVMMILEAIIKISVVEKFKVQSVEERVNPAWRKVIWPGGVYTGVFFGLAALTLLLPLPTSNLMVLFSVYLGIYIFSCWLGSCYMPIAIGMLVPLALPLAIGMALVGTTLCLLFSFALLFTTAMSLFYIKGLIKQSSDLVSARLRIEELYDKLSEEKKVAEQLVVNKSRFIASASHDLRQPLHALGLYHSAIRKRMDDEGSRTLMNSVDKSTAALNNLFEGLLDVSKLDAGVVEPSPEHFSIGSLFAKMDDEFHQLARANGLELVIVNKSCVVHSDPFLVERVIRNLLGNAISYTEEGSVVLSATNHDRGVLISVSDTGAGIPETEFENIFNEFHQIEHNQHHDEKGFGLGLAIVERISRLLEFDINLVSSVENGTQFTFVLPSGERKLIRGLSDIAVVEDIKPGTRILVVDDNASILDAMETALNGWGVDSLLATSTSEAIQSLDELNFIPDLIICDYHLAESFSGVEAAEAIKHKLGLEIPVIIITGDTTIELMEEGQVSSSPVLVKPVRPEKLREAIVFKVAASSSLKAAL